MATTKKDFQANAAAIAATNPRVDLTIVDEARVMIAERRAKGRPRRGYNLVSSRSRPQTKK